jgi:hypothetical protein
MRDLMHSLAPWSFSRKREPMTTELSIFPPWSWVPAPRLRGGMLRGDDSPNVQDLK